MQIGIYTCAWWSVFVVKVFIPIGADGRHDVPFQNRKSGVGAKLIIGDAAAQRDITFIQKLPMAHHYLNEIESGKPIAEIATASNTSNRRIMPIIEFAFLAPDIVKSIFQGKEQHGLTSKYLQRHLLPADCQKQRQVIQAI